MRKDRQIHLRLTESDYRFMTAYAASHDLTMAACLRSFIRAVRLRHQAQPQPQTMATSAIAPRRVGGGTAP